MLNLKRCAIHLKYVEQSFARFASTIFAPSSGHGKCGVSVIRVSGKSSSIALATLTRRSELPPARKAVLRKLFDPTSGLVLDHALALWFPGPRSFTGEDTCELHVHGGPAVVKAVLNALSNVPDLRPAESGEFTRRAFHAGKLDLTQVEGLSDLIHAETEQQRRQALRQMDGGLYKQFQTWRNKLIKIVASVEAYIDFAESEEIEEDVLDEVRKGVCELRDEFDRHLNDARVGERLREGVHLAIVGEPNVGKSSLLNFLVQRPAAIVSSTAGTTRDVLETCLDLGGFPVNICDTAGLRKDTEDPIEKEGIDRAVSAANRADLVVQVVDVRKVSELNQLSEKFSIGSERRLTVVNKIDLLPDWKNLDGKDDSLVFVSLKSGEGLSELMRRLQGEVETLCQTQSIGECPTLTRDRHRHHLRKSMEYLVAYLESELRENDIVICAHQLRQAIREIGFITGKVSSDKILDVVFSDFCIGK